MKYIVLVFVLCSFLNAQNMNEKIQEMTAEDMAKFISNIVGSKLPKRLDDITIAKGTSYNRNTYELKKYITPKDEQAKVKYRAYLEQSLYEQQKFYDFVKSNELKNICNSTLLRVFLHKGGIVKIDYHNFEEENILFVLIKNKDCS
jgi:hypothetical protein